jgi:hypothetical protein
MQHTKRNGTQKPNTMKLSRNKKVQHSASFEIKLKYICHYVTSIGNLL